LIAATVQVYVVPWVRLITVSGLAVPEVAIVVPPFEERHVAA
jgi:hypothetical protein